MSRGGCSIWGGWRSRRGGRGGVGGGGGGGGGGGAGGGGGGCPLGGGAGSARGAALGWVSAAGALPAWRAIVFDYLVPLYSRLGRGAGWSIYRPEVWIALGAGVVITLASALAARRFGPRHAVAVLGTLYG